MMDIGPIRTALFVPGNRSERFPKALNSGADRVIIDLEDAVPIAAKEAAREDVANYLGASADPRIIVRVNAVETLYFEDDIARILAAKPTNLLIPKVESSEDMSRVNRTVLRIENENRIEAGTIKIFALIETAKAVDAISEIVHTRTEPHRLVTLIFGAADYTADLGIEMTPDGTELLYPRSRLAVACRAGGLEPPVDTPFMIDLKDIDALGRDALVARQLGYQGKLCIHPNQIETVNRVFSPNPAEIRYAERVIEAFEEAEAAGQGALLVDGKFVDYPIVARARRILQNAAAIDRH